MNKSKLVSADIKLVRNKVDSAYKGLAAVPLPLKSHFMINIIDHWFRSEPDVELLLLEPGHNTCANDWDKYDRIKEKNHASIHKSNQNNTSKIIL